MHRGYALAALVVIAIVTGTLIRWSPAWFGRESAHPAPERSPSTDGAVAPEPRDAVQPGASRSLDPGPQVSHHACAECPEMVAIPPGSFQMGSPPDEKDRDKDEGPQHEVHIRYAFSVSKYPITRAEWKRFVTDTGHSDNSDCVIGQEDDHPVVCVSWEAAREYAAWLSAKSGEKYRLLTEAEWEYAARAGTTTAYYWGSEIGRGNADCNSCGSRWDERVTAPVKSFAPNGWGLYSMAGNVFSWTLDCYHPSYSGAPEDGRAWVSGDDCNDGRVVRGGAWSTSYIRLRSAYRSSGRLDSRDVGFRVARMD